MIGAYRARAVPYNVNHHYNAGEVGALLAQIGADAVVYHRRLAPLLAEADLDGTVLIDVDDGSGAPPLPGSTELERAIGAGADVAGLPAPSPDDRYLVCTGGTTGRPKGVLWRQADVYVSAMGGMDGATAESITGIATNGAGVWFAAPPLMHAAAQWTVFAALHNGATVVLHDDSVAFDARTILETAARERVTLMTIVGDAYARPLVEELRRTDYDLSSLASIGTGGAVTSQALKEELLDLVPHLTITDGYGSSETGGMAFGLSRKGEAVRRFAPSSGATVLSEDRTRFLAPGDEEIGLDGARRTHPAGLPRRPRRHRADLPHHRRPAGVGAGGPGHARRRTGRSRSSGATRWSSTPAARRSSSRRWRRPSACTLTSLDALVVGRPSERFGEEVVALVQLRPGAELDARRRAGLRGAVGGAVQGPPRGAAVRPPRPPPLGQAGLPVGPRGAPTDAVDRPR